MHRRNYCLDSIKKRGRAIFQHPSTMVHCWSHFRLRCEANRARTECDSRTESQASRQVYSKRDSRNAEIIHTCTYIYIFISDSHKLSIVRDRWNVGVNIKYVMLSSGTNIHISCNESIYSGTRGGCSLKRTTTNALSTIIGFDKASSLRYSFSTISMPSCSSAHG